MDCVNFMTVFVALEEGVLMAPNKDARKSRRKDQERMQRTRQPIEYPEGVTTEEDRQEYRAFRAGLPRANEIFFANSLQCVRTWVQNECPTDQWGKVREALRNIAFHISFLDNAGRAEKNLATALKAEAKKEVLDVATARAAWNDIVAWARG